MALLLGSTALIGVFAPLKPALAQSATWSAAPADSIYSNGANWVGGTPATGVGSTATFGTSTGTTVTLDNSFDMGTFRVQNNTAYTFNYGAAATLVSLSAGMSIEAGSSAIINTSNGALLQFLGGSAQTTTIVNGATLEFQNSATTGNAVITNNSVLSFYGVASTGSGTITTTAGGTVGFFDSAVGGNAAFLFTGNGNLNISGLAIGQTTVGSIESASVTSEILLGAKQLNVGNNNASTTFDGVISGPGGSLRKNGTGTLTLTGVNTYTGGTTLAGGALAISNDNNLGAAPGALTFLGLGATLLLNGNVTSARTVTLNGSGGTIDTNGNALTLSGAIGGTGDLNKTGTGTLTLTNAANNYAGTTTVNAGTLIIDTGASIASSVTNNATFNNAGTANGGVTNNGIATNTGTITGGVTNTGTFDARNVINGAIVNASTGTFNVTGALAGDGSTLSNSGGARLNVTGGNFTGLGAITNSAMINVAAGRVLGAASLTQQTGSTLVNNGTVSANLTVNGGTIGGTGTFVGNMAFNGGTFAPGNSIGTITVNGNLAFTSAATYLVEIDTATSDRSNVSGTASPGGARVSAIYASGSYVTRRYTILNAAGGVVGTFASLVNTNLPANFRPALSYDANNVYLDLTLNFTPTPTPTPGPTPAPTSPNYGNDLSDNQNRVANALINSFNTAGGIPLVFGMLSATGLTQISGQHATGTQQTTFDAMDKFVGLLTDPSARARAGSLPQMGASGYAEEDESLGYAAKRKRTGAERDAYAAFKAPSKPTFERRWSVWGAGYGSTQSTDGNAGIGSQKLTNHVYGGAAGFDYRLTPETLVGFALGGAGTTYGLANGLGGGRSEMFQAGLYGRHTSGPAYISGALAWGWQDITTSRTVFANSYRAGFAANAVTGRLEGGWRFAYGTSGITPYAAGQITSFFLPGYAESLVAGVNAFALTYADRDVTASRTELGLRGDTSFAAADAIVTLRGRAAWAHNFNTERSIAAIFQTLPASGFTVFGAAPAQNSALVSAGAEAKWLNGFSVAATFEGEFSKVTDSYAGKGIVRYQW